MVPTLVMNPRLFATGPLPDHLLPRGVSKYRPNPLLVTAVAGPSTMVAPGPLLDPLPPRVAWESFTNLL